MENENQYKNERFDSFINKTIILSSKKYYKNEITKANNEINIMDDENYSEYMKEYVKYDDVYEARFVHAPKVAFNGEEMDILNEIDTQVDITEFEIL